MEKCSPAGQVSKGATYMKAVISVIGKDTVGIIARVSDVLSAHHINILDITQSVLGDLFAMITLVDITTSNVEFASLKQELEAMGEGMGLDIHCMHASVFDTMHKV